MTQLIAGALLDKGIPPAALFGVSPGLNQSLTPWYITKHADRTVNQVKTSSPLSWKTVKSLYTNSSFSFQYTTKLSIKIENEQEMNEFIDSDAAKSLFKQAHTLHLTIPTIYNPEVLASFINKFGRLEWFRLAPVFDFVPAQHTSAQHRTNIFSFFNEMFSNALQRNLCLGLVTSLHSWHYVVRENFSPTPAPSNNQFESLHDSVFKHLVNLMVEFNRVDNGKSIATFSYHIQHFIISSSGSTASFEPTRKMYDCLRPMFDLLVETIIPKGGSERIISQSSCEHPFYQKAAEITSAIQFIIDFVVAQSNEHQVVSDFVQNYGKPLLRAFSRFSDGDASRNRYSRIVGSVLNAFSSFMKNYNSNASRASRSLDEVIYDLLFPLDDFCKYITNSFIDDHDHYYSGRVINNVVSDLVEAVQNMAKSNNSCLTSDPAQKCFLKIAETLYNNIVKFASSGEFAVRYHVSRFGAFHKLLFGSDGGSLDLDDDSSDNDDRAKRAFHEKIQSSLFDYPGRSEMLNSVKDLVAQHEKWDTKEWEKFRDVIKKNEELRFQRSSSVLNSSKKEEPDDTNLGEGNSE